MQSLKTGGFGGGTKRGSRARAAMVAAQVAMSTVLLVIAGLLVRSSLEATSFDPGFETSRGTIASVDLRFHGYGEAEGRRLQERMLEGARNIPGVDGVVLTSGLAPFGLMSGVRLDVEGDTSEHGRYARRSHVSPGLFRRLGFTLLGGREFSEADVAGAPLVAVVNQALADLLGPARSAVGRRLSFATDAPQLSGTAAAGRGEQRPIEIIGVVANTPTDPRRPDRIDPVLYVPVAQHYSPRMTVVVTSNSPAAMVEPLRRAIRSIDPDLAVLDAGTLSDGSAMVASVYRVIGLLVSTLAAIGFGTAVFGLYGVLSFAVSQRTREFGIRRALGATTRVIYAMVVRSGVTMALAGAAVGIGVALLIGQVIGHLLYGVAPYDPLTLAVVAATLISTVVAGSALAARRAARVDPNVALRDL
jgi:predicted permease